MGKIDVPREDVSLSIQVNRMEREHEKLHDTLKRVVEYVTDRMGERPLRNVDETREHLLILLGVPYSEVKDILART